MHSKRNRRNNIEVSRVADVPQEAVPVVGIRLPADDHRRLSEQAAIRRLRVGTMGKVAICAWLDQIEAA